MVLNFLCSYSFWRRSNYFQAVERLQFLTRAELIFFCSFSRCVKSVKRQQSRQLTWSWHSDAVTRKNSTQVSVPWDGPSHPSSTSSWLRSSRLRDHVHISPLSDLIHLFVRASHSCSSPCGMTLRCTALQVCPDSTLKLLSLFCSGTWCIWSSNNWPFTHWYSNA